jgi:hypothetical protein
MGVATANVLCTLPRASARAALRTVLAECPDLVGLQEWSARRRGLLREAADYAWVRPVLGGCAVGALRDRFEVLDGRARRLGGLGLADRGSRPVPVLPARFAAVAVLLDRRTGVVVTVVSFHLVPGVQRRGDYRADRPRLVERHRTERAALEGLVRQHLALGREVYAVGDSNFDGFTVAGLTSAWDGRREGPGTLGSDRKIDDVLGQGPAVSVRLLATPSDHRAVLARRPDPAQR